MRTCELNGNKFVYGDETVFLVQVGKDKGKYNTKYKFIGNFVHAVLWFNGINIGNGYKKRLIMQSCSKDTIIARCIS